MGIETALATVGTAAVGLVSYATGYVVPKAPNGTVGTLEAGDPILNKMDKRLLQYAKKLGDSRAAARQQLQERDLARFKNETQASLDRTTRQSTYYGSNYCQGPSNVRGRIVPQGFGIERRQTGCLTVEEAIPNNVWLCRQSMLFKTQWSINHECSGRADLSLHEPCYAQTKGYCTSYSYPYTLSLKACDVGTARICSNDDFDYILTYSNIGNDRVDTDGCAVELWVRPNVKATNGAYDLWPNTNNVWDATYLGSDDGQALCDVLRARCADLEAVASSVSSCPDTQNRVAYTRTEYDGDIATLYKCVDRPTTQATTATTTAPTTATTRPATQASTPPTAAPTTGAPGSTTQASSQATTRPTTQASTIPGATTASAGSTQGTSGGATNTVYTNPVTDTDGTTYWDAPTDFANDTNSTAYEPGNEAVNTAGGIIGGLAALGLAGAAVGGALYGRKKYNDSIVHIDAPVKYVVNCDSVVAK